MVSPTDEQVEAAKWNVEGGLQLLLAAVHANDPKREILVRIGDLMRAAAALTAALARPAGQQDADARDAARYRRLQVIGCAPMNSRNLDNGTVLRFSGLDSFIDDDVAANPSRGEARALARPAEDVEQLRTALAEHKAEQELFDQDAAEKQRLIDRIADLIGLPHDHELDRTDFELWFTKTVASPAEGDEVLQKLIAAAEVVNKANVALAQNSASLHSDPLYRDYMFKMPGARTLDEAFQAYYASRQSDTAK